MGTVGSSNHEQVRQENLQGADVSTYETMVIIGMGLWIVLAGSILIGLAYTISLIRKVREPLREISNLSLIHI